MGQKIGKCTLSPSAEPFANLPRKAIAHLWTVFNDIADGFGISVDELVEICTDLKDELNMSRLSIIEKTTLLFELLDTDKNGLIDALEFMSTMAALSGMRKIEMIDFILTSYDFDGTAELSVDEVTLALKSVTTGLCKVCLVKTPREEMIEQLVSTMYSEMTGEESNDSMRVRINVIVEKLNAHPDVRCWFSYFGNTPQAGMQLYDLTLVDRDTETENIAISRSGHEQMASDWDIKSVARAADQIQYQQDVPWISAVSMLTPLEYSNQTMTTAAPSASIKPSWVYGYQGERSRDNVKYNFLGNIVYHTGKYVIVYGFNNHEQVIFSAHHDEVTCLTMHPEGQLVASGEAGPEPRVLVWHTVTREVVFQDRGFHKNGIAALAFSCDGTFLAAAGNDVRHRVSVHKWESKELLFSSDVDEGQVRICFMPMLILLIWSYGLFLYFNYHILQYH
jgi:microtubule-associated protein-like 6